MSSFILYNPIAWLVTINALLIFFCFAITLNAGMRKRFFSLPVFMQKLLVVLIIVTLVMIPLFPQERFTRLEIHAMICGGSLIVLSLVLSIFAFLKIGFIPSIRARRGLITDGIYGIVRNPLYTADICIAWGCALLFRSGIGLAYAPAVTVLFALLCIAEERSLADTYGAEYISYKQNVRYRLAPFIF